MSDLKAVQQMISEMTKTFINAIEQQTRTMKEIMEKKIDVMEHEVFSIKEKLEECQKENNSLKDLLKAQDNEITAIKTRLGENRTAIIENKQSKLKNDLVAICQTALDPLSVPLKNLNGPTIHRTTAKGLHIFTYSFKDIRDKIDHLKKKKGLKEQNIQLFSPLCPELKNLLRRANQVKENGTVEKVWLYRDQLYVSPREGERIAIKNEFDMEFYED